MRWRPVCMYVCVYLCVCVLHVGRMTRIDVYVLATCMYVCVCMYV
jgi:hypothetical protein